MLKILFLDEVLEFWLSVLLVVSGPYVLETRPGPVTLKCHCADSRGSSDFSTELKNVPLLSCRQVTGSPLGEAGPFLRNSASPAH